VGDRDLVETFRGDCAGGDFLNPLEGIRRIEAAPARVAYTDGDVFENDEAQPVLERPRV
jgi:hypothetical protein